MSMFLSQRQKHAPLRPHSSQQALGNTNRTSSSLSSACPLAPPPAPPGGTSSSSFHASPSFLISKSGEAPACARCEAVGIPLYCSRRCCVQSGASGGDSDYRLRFCTRCLGWCGGVTTSPCSRVFPFHSWRLSGTSLRLLVGLLICIFMFFGVFLVWIVLPYDPMALREYQLEQVRSAYPLSRICAALPPPENHLVNETEKARLKKVFERFHNVRDVHDGDTEEHTAQVRFVTSASDLSYSLLFPYLLSATVAGIPIDVLGVGDDALRLNPFLKWVYLEDFIRLEGLSDEDVVMITDGDVLFTGRDVLPMMEEFLATTARSAAEMDVVKVRTHQMRAPFLLSTEENCYIPQVASVSTCFRWFSYLEDLREIWFQWLNAPVQERDAEPRGAAGHRNPLETTGLHFWDFEKNTDYTRNTRVHPNSGSAVARVWAVKEVIQAIKLYTKSHFTLERNDQLWLCDQSAVGEVCAELMRWEFKQFKVLFRRHPLSPHSWSSSPTVNESTVTVTNETTGKVGVRLVPESSTLVNVPIQDTGKGEAEGDASLMEGTSFGPYRLTPGVMGLDYRQEFTFSMFNISRGYLNGKELRGKWYKSITSDVFEGMKSELTREVWDEKAGVHRRAFTAPLAEKSPTGIPLAPLQITGDDSSRWAADKVRLQGYPHFSVHLNKRMKTTSLSGSVNNTSLSETSNMGNKTVMGHLETNNSLKVMDVSIPLALGHPVAYHFNGIDKGLHHYEKIVPWIFPLHAEGGMYTTNGEMRTESAGAIAREQLRLEDEVYQPQLVALMRLLGNAPPVRTWLQKSVGTAGGALSPADEAQHLSSIKKETTLLEVCAAHWERP